MCFPYVSNFSYIFSHTSRFHVFSWKGVRGSLGTATAGGVASCLFLWACHWRKHDRGTAKKGKKNHGIWSINQVLEMPNTLPAIAVIHGTRTMFQQRLNANVHYKNDKSMCSKKNKCTWTWVFKQIIDCVPAKYHMFQQFWALCGRNALWFFKPNTFGLAYKTWFGTTTTKNLKFYTAAASGSFGDNALGKQYFCPKIAFK